MIILYKKQNKYLLNYQISEKNLINFKYFNNLPSISK